MSYNVNDPAPSDKIRNWPSSVTTNEWPRIKAIIAADHIFNNSALANDGYHNVIHFQNQSADPATIAGITQAYTKTIGTQNELCVKTGLGTFRQISGPSNAAVSGYTMLPNGFILQWGVYTAPGTGVPETGTINFQTGNGAFTTAVYSVQTTFSGSSGTANTMQVNAITIAKFDWETTTNNTNSYTGFLWFAIGV